MLDGVAGRNAERNPAERNHDGSDEEQEKNTADPGGSTRQSRSSRLHDCHTVRTRGRLRRTRKPRVHNNGRLDIDRRGRRRRRLIGVLVATGWLGLVLHGRRVGVFGRSDVNRAILSCWGVLRRVVGFLVVEFLVLGRRPSFSTLHSLTGVKSTN